MEETEHFPNYAKLHLRDFIQVKQNGFMFARKIQDAIDMKGKCHFFSYGCGAKAFAN